MLHFKTVSILKTLSEMKFECGQGNSFLYYSFRSRTVDTTLGFSLYNIPFTDEQKAEAFTTAAAAAAAVAAELSKGEVALEAPQVYRFFSGSKEMTVTTTSKFRPSDTPFSTYSDFPNAEAEEFAVTLTVELAKRGVDLEAYLVHGMEYRSILCHSNDESSINVVASRLLNPFSHVEMVLSLTTRS